MNKMSELDYVGYILLILVVLVIIGVFLDYYFGKNKIIKKIVKFIEHMIDSIIYGT